MLERGNYQVDTRNPENSLPKAGAPMRNYSPNPECQKCGGCGFVHPRNSAGKTDFSRIVPCNAAGCLMDSVKAYLGGEGLMIEHGIEPRKAFENFRITGKCAGAREAYQTAQEFADGEANYVNLLIYGGVGCGKTHLCNAVARRMHERGIETRLYTVADLLSLLRVAVGQGGVEEDINMLKECKCLILDDFKPEDDSVWALARLEEIIDFRYRCSRLMMMTTNRNLSELPERIASRFSDVDCGRVVLNEAPDYRRRLK